MGKIFILDFGSQYTQLIARRIRELKVYCEIHPFNHFPKFNNQVKGIILSGSPYSVRDKNAPIPDLTNIKGQYPLLGVCYGAQYLAHYSGGEVLPSNKREYGRANLKYVDKNSELFRNISPDTQVWMSHGDTITRIPDNINIIGSTADVEIGAFKIKDEITYGIQFHPEVYHTTEGKEILRNFVVDICGCKQSWTPVSFVETTVTELRKMIGDEKVVLGLSGGVDSSAAAVLLDKAVGKNLTCIFVDNGLLRKNEFRKVLDSYEYMDLNVIGIDARDEFLAELKGVTEPEQKRKIVGRVFIKIFEEEAVKIKNVKYLAQGTIYPDVIESVSVKGPSATIKSHHNVGGLPYKINMKVVEPLRLFYRVILQHYDEI